MEIVRCDLLIGMAEHSREICSWELCLAGDGGGPQLHFRRYIQ